MTKIRTLHRRWMKEPAYRAAQAALERQDETSVQNTGKPSRARRKATTDRPVTPKRAAKAAGDPDTFVPDAAWWKGARVVLPPERGLVTMRLDADILAWFRRSGRGYQSRINAVLRAYMRAQAEHG